MQPPNQPDGRTDGRSWIRTRLVAEAPTTAGNIDRPRLGSGTARELPAQSHEGEAAVRHRDINPPPHTEYCCAPCDHDDRRAEWPRHNSTRAPCALATRTSHLFTWHAGPSSHTRTSPPCSRHPPINSPANPAEASLSSRALRKTKTSTRITTMSRMYLLCPPMEYQDTPNQPPPDTVTVPRYLQ